MHKLIDFEFEKYIIKPQLKPLVFSLSFYFIDLSVHAVIFLQRSLNRSVQTLFSPLYCKCINFSIEAETFKNQIYHTTSRFLSIKYVTISYKLMSLIYLDRDYKSYSHRFAYLWKIMNSTREQSIQALLPNIYFYLLWFIQPSTNARVLFQLFELCHFTANKLLYPVLFAILSK